MPVHVLNCRRIRHDVLHPACRIVLALGVMAGVTEAQNAQPYAAQLSAFFTTIRAGDANVAGIGAELQQRFNRIYATESFGAVSLGLGGQYSVHTEASDRLTITGVFVEPRWVPATGSLNCYPYLSARLAIQRMTGEFQFADDGSSGGAAFGVGGGLAMKVTRQINIDAGAQLIRQQFGAIGVLQFAPRMTYTAKIGVSVGYPR